MAVNEIVTKSHDKQRSLLSDNISNEISKILDNCDYNFYKY